jgi:hypothetical protein
VTSLLDIRGEYITLEANPSTLELRGVSSLLGLNFLQAANPPSLINGLNFANGFVEFRIENVTPGGTADVRVILPAGEQPITYFQYGATPADSNDHLYEFLFDTASGTGAEFNANEVMLHFVDGDRGDSDLTANGVIVDPGAPALAAPNPGANAGSSGGGCMLATHTASARQGGAWWLLLLLLGCRVQTVYCRRG